LFRRILGKARGQYQLMPIDWDLITLPAVTNEHAMKNRLNAEQIAVVLPIIVAQYPFYAPMIFALYTLGLRYCHVAAMRWEKLTSNGVIAIEETYDVSANVFNPGGPTEEGTTGDRAGASDARVGPLAPALPDAAKPPRHQDRALVPVRGRYPAGRQRPTQRRLARGAGACRDRSPGDRARHPAQLP
jgi:hypothetical protein